MLLSLLVLYHLGTAHSVGWANWFVCREKLGSAHATWGGGGGMLRMYVCTSWFLGVVVDMYILCCLLVHMYFYYVINVACVHVVYYT